MTITIESTEQNDTNIEVAKVDPWLELFSLFIHDLESPLTTVKYLLRLIETGKYDPDKKIHQTLVRSSAIAIERAESIIYDIMAVARAGKAGLPVDLSDLNPVPIVQESIQLTYGSATENEIDIFFDSSIKTDLVIADSSLLKRALDNLLFNAVRHTPSGGNIKVTFQDGKESLFIHIKDSGPGLGDIDTELLFEKYGQLDLRKQGKHRGVGLGLYFCKLAATGMGGTILASDHIDGGAVFSIRLKKVVTK